MRATTFLAGLIGMMFLMSISFGAENITYNTIIAMQVNITALQSNQIILHGSIANLSNSISSLKLSSNSTSASINSINTLLAGISSTLNGLKANTSRLDALALNISSTDSRLNGVQANTTQNSKQIQQQQTEIAQVQNVSSQAATHTDLASGLQNVQAQIDSANTISTQKISSMNLALFGVAILAIIGIVLSLLNFLKRFPSALMSSPYHVLEDKKIEGKVGELARRGLQRIY